MLARGAFTFSLDFELIWGTRDLGGEAPFRQAVEIERAVVVDRLLTLLAAHRIRATWCIVGHLFLAECHAEGGRKHPEIVPPRHAWLPDWFADDPCTDEARAPLYYGRSLVDKVRACAVPQEIGSHSFSHVIFSDPGCSRETAASEVAECVRLARAMGIELRSFVFPRNEVGHLDVLAEQGFTVYRGVEPNWYNDGRRVPEPVRRAAHIVDVVRAREPPVVLPTEVRPGLWNLPGSMLYFPAHGVRGRIPVSRRVTRALRGLEAAVRERKVFHLWLHPTNLSDRTDEMFAGLETIFARVGEHVAAGRLDVLPMGEVPAALTRAAAAASAPRPPKRDPLADPALRVRAMTTTEEDLAAFKRGFEANSDGKDPRHLRWQYLGNPAKQVFTELAVDARAEGAPLAAIYATQPVWFRIDGRRVLGTQSLDTLTDKAHRGKGLFVALAARLFARAPASGIHFVYGFPNGSSAPGFFGKLGWSNLDPVPFLIKPLRSSYLLRRVPRVGDALGRVLPDVTLGFAAPRLPPGYRIEALTRFDARTDAVWDAFARDVGAAIDRTHEYMNWRFVDKPSADYAIHGLFKGDTLEALVVTTSAAKHGGKIGYVAELLFVPGAAGAARSLLGHAVAALRDDGCDALLAWCFPHSASYPTFLREGFVPFPEKLRPIQLHFGVRAFSDDVRPTLEARERWYLSYADSDTV